MPKVSKTECCTPWLRRLRPPILDWYDIKQENWWVCCEAVDEKWDVGDARRIRVHISSAPVKGAIKATIDAEVSRPLKTLFESMGWINNYEPLIKHVWWWVEIPNTTEEPPDAPR